MKDIQSIQGRIKFKHFNRLTGQVLEIRDIKNIIVTAGKDFLAEYLVNTTPTAPFMNYLQLGTNGTDLGAAIAVGATSISVNENVLGTATTGSIVLNPSTPGNTNTDTETVTVSAVSGTGPYTYTISATVNAHAAGEPVVMEALATDTKLGIALGSTASVATQSYLNNTWTDTVTFTSSTNENIYEAGIFSASAGSGTAVMYSHATFSPFSLTSTSNLEVQWTITYA